MSNRSCWDGKGEGLHGDLTTTGAQCISSYQNTSTAGLGALRIGDKTTNCPKCGKQGVITEGHPWVILDGIAAAVDGAEIMCGCPRGTNRLVAPAGQWMGSKPGPEPDFLTQPIQYAQAAKTVQSEKREAVDAGFCVMPFGATTETFLNYLFNGEPPVGVKELFRSLNGNSGQFKAGTIMLLVDPAKQDSTQIAHMQAAKQRIDAALAPLTYQEADFLQRNKDTIDLFTSHTSLYGGAAADAAGKYFEKVESILAKIQTTYKNQYLTSGTLIGEQFFVKRKQLFKELDGVLTDFTKFKIGLQDYPDIRRSLGLSSSAITHRWNQTGVSDIEGYATYMENAAKYVKLMKKAGYVGIALDGVNRLDKVYEACTVGSDCAKISYTEVGSFSGAILAPIYAAPAVASTSTAVCAFVLGALTVEVGGAGALACGIIVSGAAGYGISELGGKSGEYIGETIYEITK
jgi:uncharacterized Zn-binding protein involved in type VI secretion